MSTTLTPHEELLKIQKKIFRRNDEFIRSQALVQERGFEAYERRYKRQVHSYDKVSDIQELLAEIQKADLIYLGDYHTNPQSQRMLLRLLKLLDEKEVPVSVGLELVQKKHQKILDDFLAERISEEQFLRKIEFQRYWYFDLWQNFKPIFDFSRYHKIPVYSVEWSLAGNISLIERDDRNATLIAQILKQRPDRKLIVFVGDLHIAPPHLPEKVQKQADQKIRSLILYQNSESIYWKLAEKGLETKTEIVRVDERSFCLMNTPPIVWQQSYLHWLEQEEGEIDYADAKHSFLELLNQISQFLEIPPQKGAEEVEVFTCGDSSFLRRLAEDPNFPRRELRRIKKQILASESYCIPEKKMVYLANLSLNHAAEEASHYLKALCSGLEFPRDPVDAFYANVMNEAVGFFGSKIINHKRKCFHEAEYHGLVTFLRNRPGLKGREKELEMALLILDHKKLEKRGSSIRAKRFFITHPDLFFGVTHGLGYILGDKLTYALLEGKVSKEEIRALYFDPMKGEGEPFQLYMKSLKKVRGVKIPRRV